MDPISPSRALAALALAAAAATATIATPAQANTGAASAVRSASASAASTDADAVRYAWLKSCTKKDVAAPCGAWTLSLRSGRTVELPDARVHPAYAGGESDMSAGALFTVSGDGRVVNYFKGDRLVVRNVSSGKVRPLPGRAASLPRGLDMSEVDVALSPDGSIIAVDYLDTSAKLPTLIADVENGKVAELPSGNTVLGFSPDGRHLLTSRFTDDNTTEFAVFDTGGRKTASQIVPQIVSNNSPVALADDGTTVALIATGASGVSRLRTYDLASDTVSDAVVLGIPKGEAPQRLFWDPAGTLTLWTSRGNAEGDITSAVQRTVGAATGTTRRLDSFKIRSGLWTWWLPGE
jgi:WD40 repeat protein